MHKLIDYICDEIDELEKKASKEGKLSSAELQYLDTLAHTKKNLLKSEEMMEEGEYSMEGGSYRSYARGRGDNRGGSYEDGNRSYAMYDDSMARGRGRNARRDSMGRYSRGDDSEMMVQELRDLMEEAPDERTKMEFKKFIQKIEQM